MKNRKTYKPQSEDLKYFEELLGLRLSEEYPNPQDWWIFDGGPDKDVIVRMVHHWEIARILVDALENAHLDDDYTPGKKYPIEHPIDRYTASERRYYGKKGDPDEVIRTTKTRFEIVTQLEDIAHLNLGDDPDIWRRWYNAYEEDDFFPPVR